MRNSAVRAAIAILFVCGPDAAVAHYNMGKVRDEQGKTEDAVTSYNRAIELDPKRAQAWIDILGTLFFTVFTIGAFLLRLFKVDPMRRRFEPELSSYRVPRSPRPATHLKRQF